MEQQHLRGNIRKIYVYKILSEMIFPVPILVLFWQENGLNLTQVMVLQSLFALAVVILEVPSGYWADLFGRKTALIVAGGAYFAAMAVYSIGRNFGQFLIAEMCFAVAVSLVSGADTALVYDTLQATHEEHRYQAVYGKICFYNLLGIAFANIVGGLLAKLNFRVTFYAALPFFLLLAPTAGLLHEPPRKKLLVQQGYLPELFKIMKYCFGQNLRLRGLIVYAGVILGLNNAAVWLYQPYFKLCGLDVAYFGLAFASFQIVAAISSKYAYKIEQLLGARFSLMLLVILTGTGYLLMGQVIFLWGFTFAFLQQFVRGFAQIVITDYINQLTASDIRATVLSVQSLTMRLFYALIIPLAGKIADDYSLMLALQILGLTTLLVGALLLLILHKNRVL